MNTPVSKKEIVIKLMGLSIHCAATADQAGELCANLKKGKLNRKDAVLEVQKLEKHMDGLLKLIRQIAQDYHEPEKRTLELVKRPSTNQNNFS